MPIKIRDLAKELEVADEKVMEALQKLFVDVEDESTLVDDKIAALMRVKLGGGKPVVKKKAKKEPAKEKKPIEEKKETKKKKTKETKEEEASDKSSKEKSTSDKKKTKTKAEKEKDKEEKKPKTRGVIVVKKAEKVVEEQPEPEDQPAEEEVDKKEQVSVKEEKEGSLFKKLDKVVIVKTAKELDEENESRPKSSLKKKDRRKQEKEDALKKSRQLAAGAKRSWRSEDVKKPFVKKVKKILRPVKHIKRAEIASEEITLFEGEEYKKLEMQVPANIRAIAVKINKRPNDLMQFMVRMGQFVNINQDLGEEVVREVVKSLGYELVIPKSIEQDLMAEHHEEYEEEKHGSERRAPVVTFMGHVDHGKTSLLDYIRKTMVTEKEKGGITQHIGAYKVDTGDGGVTFLDTPGHAAFTAMRARGAEATDAVVLVVSADDGVMPQTKEAIDHARAAGVPIVVAINKCDLPGADPDRVRIELQKESLVAEEYGGKTVMLEVSAKTGKGVDALVEMLMLEADLLELKANPDIRARGAVLEGKKTGGQGVMATVLVKNGTLKLGDVVFTGVVYGKIKAMINDRGERVKEAPPSTPVEILGLQGMPEAGDEFYVVKDEKKAKTLSDLKQGERKKNKLAGSQRVSLEDFHARLMEGKTKQLNIILKADVQGSVEALKGSLEALSTSEVKVSFAHAMVGDINESNIMLAVVSNSVIMGFGVKMDTKAIELGKKEKVDVRLYDIIYEAVEDVKAAMEGLLEPVENEVFQGSMQIKQVFSSKKGKAAGCMVTKGTIHRKDRVRIKRGSDIVFDGTISALKRFKDDVKEVKEGFECGISFTGSK
jgi:translation initiation factor IF-2